MDPLPILRQGYVLAGGKYSASDGHRVISGQLYAELLVPVEQAFPWPIVMVPGGGQSATNFIATPDGREGWAQFFLRRGYVVYLVDQPGRGRSAYHVGAYGAPIPPVLEEVQKYLVAPERYRLWPQADRHTQWPGGGAPGDEVFDRFFAAQMPAIADVVLAQTLNRDALLALLAEIGPAVLLTHSQSGGFGWPVADARPDLVKALVAIEPNGPPFFNVEHLPGPQWFSYAAVATRPWGLAAIPLYYSPPATSAADLQIVCEEEPDGPELVRCWRQQEPARSLPNLQQVPILVLTAEASNHACYDHCTVKFLAQAGVAVTFLLLPELGIRGNGHMVMLERNSREVAAVVTDWLEGVAARRPRRDG